MIQSDCVHSYGESTVIVEPTCVKVGKSHRFCSLCGNELFEVIPETEHSYDASGVCDICGYSLSAAPGDFDNDYRITSSDMVLLKKHLLGIELHSGTDASGDLNGDFGVDIVDAVRIKKHLSSADITSMLTYSVIGAVVAYRCRFFRQKLIFK